MKKSEAQAYKTKLYAELAKVGKCLSSARRLELLELLIQCEKTVESLATETQMTVANTSQHLQILFKSQLVKRRKRGNFVVYSLASPQVAKLASSLKQVGIAQLEQMQAVLDQKSGRLTISLAQAKHNHAALFLDVRPADEYQAGHIAGAVNIPFGQLAQHVSFLPQDREIIVYCRGKLCTYAELATSLLNEKGYQAYSLNASYYDWQAEDV